MGYYSPAAIINVFEDVKHLDPDNYAGPKLLLGGVMGDAAHFQGGGYHVPRAYLVSQLPGDYSIQLPVDQRGDAEAASAIDLSSAYQDGQHLLTRRLLDATGSDHRLRIVREWAGSLDSVRVTARSLRPDGVRDVSSQFDSGHLTHVHISIDRAYCNDTAALAALADLLAGVPDTGHNSGGHHTPSGVGHHRLTEAPKWPLAPGNWFGLVTGPRRSHGGVTMRERRGIRRIQKRLNALGYGPLVVDGRFGPATANAVATWQRKTRPDQTSRPGQVWPDDWRALLGKTAG